MGSLRTLSMRELLSLINPDDKLCEPDLGHDEGDTDPETIAAEVARRITKNLLSNRRLLDNPALVAQWVAVRYFELDQEVVGALFLTSHGLLLSECEIFKGSP